MSDFDNELDMYVVKRSGETEVLSYKKILERTKKLGSQFNINLNYTSLVMKIMDQLFNNIKTSEIDELMCQTCAALGSTDYDYYRLASALCISNHQKEVSEDFELNYQKIYGNDSGYLSKEFLDIIHRNADYFKSILDYSRDYDIDYFGYKTLERAYLMKHDKVITERIQHMWLRVAIQIHGDNLEKVKETYNGMSQKYFIHATPTLFNSGTKRPQLSSCYLIGMEDDSIDGIFNTLHDCASISKWAGGIGLHIHNIRAKGTQIIGTNGVSNGLVPMLRVFNNTARYVDQCVVPETYIYTKDGPKQIQYVQKGVDEIYNEQGGLEVIQNVLEHAYDGQILEIKTQNSDISLRITPEHPVLSICSNEFQGYNEIMNRISTGLLHVDYHDAKELDNNSFLVFKIPEYYEDISSIYIEDVNMYGLMSLYLDNECFTTNFYSMTFPHTYDVESDIEEVMEYLNHNMFKYTISKDVENKLTQIKWTKSVNFKFYVSDFVFQGKRIISSRMLNLPVHKTNEILNKLNVNYCSDELSEYIRFLKIKNGNISTHLDACFSMNGYIFDRVKSITSSHYEGVLYDLQMEKEHNYMIHNSIVHNGGGKRSGSFAMYLEPWHADIEDFLELRKNHGDEEARARDLFYALWIPDLFMKRVSDDDYWYLMCPNVCKGLSDCYGEDFETLYNSYVEKGMYKRKMKARELWFQVLDSQMETGTPYMLYKDACNKKSNQSNLGVIKSSNLCVAPETLIMTDKGNIEISTVSGDIVNVWNGYEWSTAEVRKTGENQKLMKIVFSNDKTIDCTYYHKFYIYNSERKIIKVEAQQLSIGDQIIDYIMPTDEIVQGITVKEIIETGRIDDTYCFTEPKRHMGIFNGIITGQCTEIIEYSDKDETAVCNLASISLSAMVDESTHAFNFDKLQQIAETVTENLNRIIDCNFYPTMKTYRSNMNHRPIGIGVQGLADAFAKMDLPFDSDEAQALNKDIFETIYYASMKKSNEISTKRQSMIESLQKQIVFDLYKTFPGYLEWFIPKFEKNYYDMSFKYNFGNASDVKDNINMLYHSLKPTMQEILGRTFYTEFSRYIQTQKKQHGHRVEQYAMIPDNLKEFLRKREYCGAYSSFEGCPLSQGKFQFDLWNVEPSSRYNWESLRDLIMQYGTRNSLCLAPMPTASTSQILANNECFEPFTSNIYSRRTLAGEFVVINKYLMKELKDEGIWSRQLKDRIIENKGSIQNIPEIPEKLRQKYKIVWDISMKRLIDMAKERGAYICQSQSMNLWVEDPNYNNLTKMHFYSWRSGLKTGIYYLRRKAKHQAQQFTIEPTKNMSNSSNNISGEQDEPDACEMCGA
jgi:ribonucleotide reductase alpha subunit